MCRVWQEANDAVELLARVVFGMVDGNHIVDAEAVAAAGRAQSVAANGRTTTLGEKFVEWLQRESMVKPSRCCACLPAYGAAGAACGALV